MRHAVQLIVIAVAAVAVASILLPSEPWAQKFVMRAIAILVVGLGCYLAGFANGKGSIETAVHPRRWLQFSTRTILLVTTLFAVCLGLYCDRARQQREVVQSLTDIAYCYVRYDHYYRSHLGETPDSGVTQWLSETLGKDFVHQANSVAIYASDVERALPHLKRIRNLKSVYVILDRDIDLIDATKWEERRTAREKVQMDSIRAIRFEFPHVHIQASDDPPPNI